MMWLIIDILDFVLFAVVALTVIYLVFYAFASTRYQRIETGILRKHGRFLVILTCNGQQPAIEDTIRSLLHQDYDTKDFDVLVSGFNLTPLQAIKLAQYPIHLLRAKGRGFHKQKAHEFAVLQFQNMKIYDQIVFLDPGETVTSDFLSELNKVLQSGIRFCQLHRRPVSTPSHTSQIIATMEEINNSIFRKGHVAIGCPSALAPSGYVIDYNWYKAHMRSNTSNDEIKGLENLLLKERVFVDYVDEICVYTPAVEHRGEIAHTRKEWIEGRLGSLFTHLRGLLPAFFSFNFSLCDKILQWLMLPRIIMMGVIMLMSLILPFIYFTLAIKWWVLFLLVTFAFALGTPDYLVDKEWTKSMLIFPVIFIQTGLRLMWQNPVVLKLRSLLKKGVKAIPPEQEQ